MNKLNNKGFFLVETLVVIGITILILTIFYKQINTLYHKYEQNFDYNTVQSIHAVNNIILYIEQEVDIVNDLLPELGTNPYLDLSNYSFSTPTYYAALKNKLDIKKIYFTRYNINNFIDSAVTYGFDAAFINYLQTLKFLIILDHVIAGLLSFLTMAHIVIRF